MRLGGGRGPSAAEAVSGGSVLQRILFQTHINREGRQASAASPGPPSRGKSQIAKSPCAERPTRAHLLQVGQQPLDGHVLGHVARSKVEVGRTLEDALGGRRGARRLGLRRRELSY